MGFFDLLSPVFAWVDTSLGFVPPFGRLVIWAAIGSVMSMGLYWRFSSQEKMSALKSQIAETRQQIKGYDGDLEGLRPLLLRSIRLSLHQFGVAIGPTVAASLPVLFLLVWLGSEYSFALPTPGRVIKVRVTPARADTQWDAQHAAIATGDSWQVVWPHHETKLNLADSQGRHLLSLPLDHAVPIIHKRVWWNSLFGNPVGYLPSETPVERLDIELPRKRHLNFGPTWMRRWETIFFTILVAFSFAIKSGFRIH